MERQERKEVSSIVCTIPQNKHELNTKEKRWEKAEEKLFNEGLYKSLETFRVTEKNRILFTF